MVGVFFSSPMALLPSGASIQIERDPLRHVTALDEEHQLPGAACLRGLARELRDAGDLARVDFSYDVAGGDPDLGRRAAAPDRLRRDEAIAARARLRHLDPGAPGDEVLHELR